jgi:hypothetical protein
MLSVRMYYIVFFFPGLTCLFAPGVTIQPKDLNLARRLRGERS